ncbi:MAG: MMPL family transporter [Pseudomonadales bacterium]|nr:MMPL family transporter [Pseudomonadales bacterium]MDP6827067.1 MMPL family transporter [Pseudomonadales bacterium]
MFYGKENPHFQNLVEFEAKYTPNNNVLYIVSATTPLHQNPTLREAIRWLDRESWTLSNVIRVDSLASYPVATQAPDNSTSISDILSTVCPANHCDQSLLWRLEEPQLVRRFISLDKHVTGILLTFELDLGTTTEIQRITAEVEVLANRFSNQFSDLELRFTGGVPMMHAFGIAAVQDLALLIPIAILTCFLLLILILRNLTLTLIALLLGTVTGLGTLGIAGHLGFVVNTATSTVPLVMFTLVVASSMHLLLTYITARTEESLDNSSSVFKALELNSRPTLLTALTSIFGFISMNFADAPPLGELGLLVSIGIVYGTTILLVFVPALLHAVDPQRPPFRFNDLIRATTVNRQNFFLVSATVFTFFTVAGTAYLELNDDFISYFGEDFEFRKHSDYAADHLSGPNHIELDYESGFPGGVFTPDYHSTLGSLIEHLRSSPHVTNVISIQNSLVEAARTFGETTTGLQLASYDSETLAQLFLSYELALWFGQNTSDFINPQRSSSRVSILLGNTSSNDILQLEESITQWFTANGPKDHSLVVTGENIPVAHLTSWNFGSMIGGIVLSLTLASIATAVSFRSVYLATCALFATLIPITMGFGLWGWIFSEIGLAAAVVIAVTLGIIIDDAIHMISRYNYEVHTNNLDSEQATLKALVGVGQAIMTTSIVLVFGFGLLAFSSFGLNKALGICTVFVLVCALVFDACILPRILARRSFRLAIRTP